MINYLSTFLWTNTIPTWLEAIGTVSAVIVALFHKPIISFINRPRIRISCPNDNICVAKVVAAKESSTKEQSIIVRVKVENIGKSAVLHSEAIVDTVYRKQISNTDYVQSDYAPIYLKDYRGESPKAIAQNLKYYFDVAVISKHDVMSAVATSSEQKQFYKLSLITGKSLQILGKGTFIIPVKLCGTKLNTPAIAYLKIYWDSDVFTDSPDCFSATVIDEKEFKSIKIINS